MRVGVTLPQTEMGTDPIAVRDYVQAVEQLGYHHINSLDHVLGANAASRPDWQGPHDHNDLIHEPFVLFGYLAAITNKVELSTTVVILPQRQTALVAKQVAEIDVLSGGRMRLGIGIGWNDVEFEALGENFHDRGRRSEEQIEVMRELWTRDLVPYNGRWHTITDAGINPLPVRRPIPVWLGGGAERAIRRVARIGDGWLPYFAPDESGHVFAPDEDGRATIERLHSYAREAGRDPGQIGIEGRIMFVGTSPEDRVSDAKAWSGAGATHLSVRTVGAQLPFPGGHIDAVRQVMGELRNAGIT